MAFDGQAHPGHRRHLPRPTGNHDPHLFRADRAARGLHAFDDAAFDIDAGDFAILDDIDATLIGPTGIAPCDGIMSGRAAARMQQTAVDREPDIVEIQIGQMFADPVAVQQHRIIALIDHRIATPGESIALAVRMEQVDQPTLGMHHVIVQVLFQRFPQFERMGIEFRIAGQKVVGAHDGGVATHVAAADIALFQNGNIGQTVFFRQVKGRR